MSNQEFDKLSYKAMIIELIREVRSITTIPKPESPSIGSTGFIITEDDISINKGDNPLKI